ncbi:MAG: hypothetical protein CMN32_06295 [Saprospirales bacterium]|nr:hypothetical protein [Saprospirales bacterium]
MKATPLFSSIFLTLAIGLTSSHSLNAQACPACSNPALQSSEKLEAGLDTLRKGSFRTTFNLTNGFDYQGGHPNNKGLSPEGDVIEVPLHNHVVELDFVRTELALEYTFAENWSIWLRIPYDVKIQQASVEYPLPVTAYEREAILRNRDIHHRSETYNGVSDLRLLLAHRINGFLLKNGRLDFALGTSLPTGRTEENPLTAGELGLRHLHIQFGSGTFDPLLELHYAAQISDRLSLAVFSINKFPFYENTLGYMAPIETTSGLSLGYYFSSLLSPRLTLANFSQSSAKWNGVDDPNSGLVSWNLTFNLTFSLKNGLIITPGYRMPLAQRTLDDEGDTFEYGPTFLLNISRPFQAKK